MSDITFFFDFCVLCTHIYSHIEFYQNPFFEVCQHFKNIFDFYHNPVLKHVFLLCLHAAPIYFKPLDTFGNCQRPAFLLAVLHQIINPLCSTILTNSIRCDLNQYNIQLYKKGFVKVRNVIYRNYSRLWFIGTSLHISLLFNLVFINPF